MSFNMIQILLALIVISSKVKDPVKYLFRTRYITYVLNDTTKLVTVEFTKLQGK